MLRLSRIPGLLAAFVLLAAASAWSPLPTPGASRSRGGTPSRRTPTCFGSRACSNSLHTDNPVIEERNYIEQAAIINHYGMPDEAALETVTINPAKILAIDNRVGSIEVGKDANLAVWTGHPLELTSMVDKVFIDGKLVYSQKDGFLPWKNRPATLVP